MNLKKFFLRFIENKPGAGGTREEKSTVNLLALQLIGRSMKLTSFYSFLHI